MSEYQYYEFLALDRPLTSNEMQQLRAFSTRARITPTSFINEYNWGNFRGDVNRFMTKYFDAFVYFANWGTHELRFRLPKAGPDKDSLLYRLAQESPMAVQREFLRRFREARRPQPPVPEASGRTVGELLAAWNRQTQEK
jgi:hypothetical protein